MSTVNQTVFEWVAVTGRPGPVLDVVSFVAQWPIYILPTLVAGVWLFTRRPVREAAVEAGVAAILAMLVAHMTSTLIDHPRPFMLGLAPNILGQPPDSSFPSDHATLFFALATTSVWAAPRLPWLGIALAGAGVAVGTARVALGVHFPFDVLGAALIGAGCAAFVAMRAWSYPLALLAGVAEDVRVHLPGLPDRRRKRNPNWSRDDARPVG